MKKIWPLFGLFSFFRIWPFLKLLMAKFGLLYIFGPGNPDTRGEEREDERERERRTDVRVGQAREGEEEQEKRGEARERVK